MTDFLDLAYLREGTARQRAAYEELAALRIMQVLGDYNPILTGTIPIGIDIESSDLDIICGVHDLDGFRRIVEQTFGHMPDFRVKTVIREHPTVVAGFTSAFPIEVFGQDVPVTEQMAYRHMCIEYAVLKEKGEDFRKAVRNLKRKGLKTEPAFAQLLGLSGNPYEALLHLSL